MASNKQKKERIITFRDPFNHQHKKVVVDGPSIFRPNQSMTVKEIYNRYVVGAPLKPMSQRPPAYDSESTFDVVPDFNNMDVGERYEFAQELDAKITRLKLKTERKSDAEVSSASEGAQPDNEQQ